MTFATPLTSSKDGRRMTVKGEHQQVNVTKYRFGVLNALWQPVRFSLGKVEPILERDAVAEWVSENSYQPNQTSSERWIYPPKSQTVRHHRQKDGSVEKSMRDRSERPALVWPVEPTHCLEVEGQPSDEDQRRMLPDILLQTLGFLFSARPQFEDWHIDGRIPAHPSNRFMLNGNEAGEVLDQVVARYEALDYDQRLALRNILHLRNRVPMYEWYWERFAWGYTVVDGCWALLSGGKPKSRSWKGTGEVNPDADWVYHRDRMERLCDDLGIDRSHSCDQEALERWVDLRNDLVHEFRWENATPAYDSSHEALMAEFHIRRFADRVILHCLGVNCDFRHKGGWADRGQFELGLRFRCCPSGAYPQKEGALCPSPCCEFGANSSTGVDGQCVSLYSPHTGSESQQKEDRERNSGVCLNETPKMCAHLINLAMKKAEGPADA